ncbi:unnamed protein product [marine sediment metagenome]|uniref:Uncharacterized protein n=1 Tax=marine sediment metagenome TaxID=412755 RepID=X1C8J1_9ZZZZ
MKAPMLIILAIVTILAVIIPITAIGQTGQPTPESDATHNIMAVVYLIPDETYVYSFSYTPGMVLREYENKLYVNGRSFINDLSEASWGFYKYKPITAIYEADEYGELIEIPQTISELGLEPIDAGDLPHSQHIAKIKSICLACAKPVTVTRKWLGVLYDIDCLVSQSIVELYQMGKVDIGDYVIVSFIDETPNSQEINIPVAVDKVYISWD